MREKTVSASRAGGKKASRTHKSRLTNSRSVSEIQPVQNRLLLVVNDSPSSKAAVDYVAKVLGHRRGFEVCLAHFLPPLPPILLEFGGSENPEKEKQLETQLRGDQQQWVDTERKKAEPALNWARGRLRRAGLPATSLTAQFSNPADQQDSASQEILRQARRNDCGTIVVGRRSLSWFRRITAGKDLAEQLVEQGKNLTVWIVE
ncbi:MAG TPA: universal stress protein [Candidatus Sulfotelmatobacter sp.]|nr:universal stress protein [Candidatus Sulfotelmatobacter sp.]